MKDYYTLFSPVRYDTQSIIKLCDQYDEQFLWDDVYPGVRLKNKRKSRDFDSTIGTKQIIESFSPDLNITCDRCQLLCLDAGEKGILHKDTDRLCGILFPITPIGNEFSHIEFYSENKDLLTSINYSEKAIILNVLRYHNVQKTHVRRINFQVDFDIPFNDVVELYNQNKLFASPTK